METIVSVVVIKENVVYEIKHFLEEDTGRAEDYFLEQCDTFISNFDEYNQNDIENIFSEGYIEFGNGSICLVWEE